VAELTSHQHAQFGCHYVDELIRHLESHRWCFGDTFNLEMKINTHAQALGMQPTFERVTNHDPRQLEPNEEQIWLTVRDEMMGASNTDLIIRTFYAPPPASKGSVLKMFCRPLQLQRQVEFRDFMERLKREMQLRANMFTSQDVAPAPAKPRPSYTVAAVLELAGVSDTTLNRYAKLAGVRTPERGKRDHRYSADEVQLILQGIIKSTSDRAMKQRCLEALNKL
jgi:hypothetical protein